MTDMFFLVTSDENPEYIGPFRNAEATALAESMESMPTTKAALLYFFTDGEQEGEHRWMTVKQWQAAQQDAEVATGGIWFWATCTDSRRTPEFTETTPPTKAIKIEGMHFWRFMSSAGIEVTGFDKGEQRVVTKRLDVDRYPAHRVAELELDQFPNLSLLEKQSKIE